MAAPISLEGSFSVAKKSTSSSTATIVDLADNGTATSQKLELSQRKQKKLEAALARAKNALGGPSVHSQVDKMTFRRKPADEAAAPDIHVRNIDLNFGSKFLLVEAGLHLSRGRRYGLVGRNGMGKTTLMRALSSREVEVPKNCRILHVEQEAHGDDTKAIDCVLAADVERVELLESVKVLTAQETVDPIAMERIYARLTEIESDLSAVKAGRILFGLGFDKDMQQMRTSEFSGGWRMRLALARALFCEYDVLLLDEPTNCLDYQSKLWLQHYLINYFDKCLLVVSHDRAFLNSGVIQHTIHLHDQKLTTYKGDYDTFEETRNELLRQQTKAHAAQEAYTGHIQQFIDKFRFNAKRASLVQSRIKALEKLKPVAAVAEDPDFVFSFPPCEELFGALVEFRNVSFCYPGESKPIFTNLNLVFSEDSRVCITGKNGQGKSTILKLLLGDIEPQSGEILINPRLKIGRFSQHHIDLLEFGMTCVDFLRKHYPGDTEQDYRGHLGRYGLAGDTQLNEISTLSGGQKSRLVFAWMSYSNPHFLVLDEPENHLDVDTVDALAVALNDYNGAVVIVSHDERLVSLCMNEMWIVDQGKCAVWNKDWEAYKAKLVKELAF